MVCSLLSQQAYRIFEAEDFAEATDVLRVAEGKVELVIVDVTSDPECAFSSPPMNRARRCKAVGCHPSSRFSPSRLPGTNW